MGPQPCAGFVPLHSTGDKLSMVPPVVDRGRGNAPNDIPHHAQHHSASAQAMLTQMEPGNGAPIPSAGLAPAPAGPRDEGVGSQNVKQHREPSQLHPAASPPLWTSLPAAPPGFKARGDLGTASLGLRALGAAAGRDAVMGYRLPLSLIPRCCWAGLGPVWPSADEDEKGAARVSPLLRWPPAVSLHPAPFTDTSL